ncbi:hypothetical protein FC093_22170 [Ilyomonas limi]|uniref:Uncharacterized protein n=1 Tax=Ilyomonas limi TaxID=2575867 RepID=A0A4U3KQK6_9BACT|nr:hypothetical protein [Ilyomonas limi]TKK64578.1 hypothetical protein FC093_22170 [Ilyomonas limi]
MTKKWMCCCLAVLCWVAAFAQADKHVLPVEALLHTAQPVTINWRDNVFSIADTPYNRFPQELLKTKDGLFLFINGSGRLYQLLERDTGIQLQRIDSTFYSGYNLGSFAFVYHDSMYSLGGYGIWRINGQLRVYIPQAHSWDIVPLNEEIPVLMPENYNSLLWYNEEDAKLYIGYSMVRNQAVKHSTLNEASFDYTVRYLDLNTKDWHNAGMLNNYFKDKISLIRNIAFTPWGQLVNFGDKLLLIDYANNRLLHLQQATENRIRPVLLQHPTTNLYYCIDSTLYFGNIAENRLHSLQLHRRDFADAGIAVYTVPLSPVVFFTEWIGSTMVILLLLFFVWKKRKQRFRKTKLSTEKPAAIQATVMAAEPLTEHTATATPAAAPAVLFSEKELLVIQLIFNNYRNGVPTTIEELNTVLGLSKINYAAQKNYRSNVLKSINAKYSLWQNTGDKLIESKKAETDKRIFTYSIAPEKEAVIAGLLGSIAI